MPVSPEAFEGVEETSIALPKKKSAKPVQEQDNDPFATAPTTNIVRKVQPVVLPKPQQAVQQVAPGKKPLQSVVNGTDANVDAQKMDDMRKAVTQYINTTGRNPAVDIYNNLVKKNRPAGASVAEEGDVNATPVGSVAAAAAKEITPAQQELTQSTAKEEIESSKRYISQFLGDNRKELDNILIMNNRPNLGNTDVNHGESFVQPGMADIGLTKANQGNGTSTPAYSTIGQNLSSTGVFSPDNFVQRLFDPTGDTKSVSQFFGGALNVLNQKEAKDVEQLYAEHPLNPMDESGAQQIRTDIEGEKKLKEIRDHYSEQRKALSQATYNIAAVKSVNRRIQERGSDAKLDPIEIGMEVRGQLGEGQKVDKDIARIRKGKDLSPDEKVSYALDGYRAMQIALTENYGNDRLAIVKNIGDQVKDYQKKILNDHPDFERNQMIRAISSEYYKEHNGITSALYVPEPGQDDIDRIAAQLKLDPEKLRGVKPDDLQNPAVWYSQLGGEFINSTAGGLYKLLLRGAGVANDALGGHTDWEAANEYLDHDWYANNDTPLFGGKTWMGKQTDNSGLFEGNSAVDTDPLSKNYLFNKENPDAGKFSWDTRAILGQVGTGAGSLLGLTAGAGEVGKLYEAGSMLAKGGQGVARFAEGSAEALAAARNIDRIGLTASTVLTGFSDAYLDGVAAFPDGDEGHDNSGLEAKRNAYALLKTGVSALAMQVLPHTKVGQDLLRPGTEAGDDLISYLARNDVKALDRSKLGQIVTAGIKALPDYVKAGSIGNIDQLGQGAVDALLAPKKYEASDQWQIQKQTAISGAIGMALPVLGIPIAKGWGENRMQRAMLWDVGHRPEPVIEEIQNMVTDGKLDPNEGNQRIAAVNTIADIVNKHVPTVSPENGLPLTPEQQQAYAQKYLVETVLGKQAESAKDEVAKKAIEKRITQLRRERSDILEQAGTKEIQRRVAIAAEQRKKVSSSQNQTSNGNEKDGQEIGQKTKEDSIQKEDGLQGQGQGRDVNVGDESTGAVNAPVDDLYGEFVNEDADGNEIPATEEPEKKVGSVPVMITKKMEADLRDAGFKQEEIDKMTPAQAHENLTKEPITPKTEANATEESNGQVKESGAEGSVREHAPVESGQQGQAKVEEAQPRTDGSDIPVSSERGQEGTQEEVVANAKEKLLADWKEELRQIPLAPSDDADKNRIREGRQAEVNARYEAKLAELESAKEEPPHTNVEAEGGQDIKPEEALAVEKPQPVGNPEIHASVARVREHLSVDEPVAHKINEALHSAPSFEEFKAQAMKLLQQQGDLNNERYSSVEVREGVKSKYRERLESELETLRDAYKQVSAAKGAVERQQASTTNVSTIIRRILEGTKPEDVVQMKARLADIKKRYRENKEALRADLPRERGVNFLTEKLARAARNGELSQEAADLAIDLVRMNPALFEDLAISISKNPNGPEDTKQGYYNAAEQIVKVFKESSDELTATHEILHHTESFLPDDVRDGIAEEWSRSVTKEISVQQDRLRGETDPKKRDEITARLLYLGLALERQSEPDILNRSDMDKVMRKMALIHGDNDYYRLSTPSEWWAVNASEIFRAKAEQGAPRTWMERARTFYDYLIKAARNVFGLNKVANVEKGLKAVMAGQPLAGGRPSMANENLSYNEAIPSAMEAKLRALWEEFRGKVPEVKGNPEIHSPASGETIETQELKDRVDEQKLRTGDAVKRRENGQYIDREGNTYVRNEENNDAPLGKSGTVQFTTKEEPPFTYQLLEAKTIQPSHIDGRRNPKFFIPEAQPKNRTDDASKAASESIANNPRLDLVGEDSGAYSGAPIVNSRGEVIQGNNRSEALKKHYEKGIEGYKDQLINEAEKFGFTPEQVNAMKEPILVRKVDVSDEKAIELGQYTQADRESSDKRGIDPTTTARRIPMDKKRAIVEAVIGDGLDDDGSTLNKLVRQNFRKAMNLLKEFITPTQFQSLADAKTGKPPEEAVSDIEKLITHFLFEGGDNELPGMFNRMPDRAKKNILNALPSIFSASPETSLVPDLQEVISGMEDFRTSESGKMSAWLNLADMFQGGRTPRDIFTPFEIKVMELLEGAKNTRDVARLFQKYGELVKGKAEDLLGPAEPGLSKAEAIQQTFNVPYNDVHEEKPGTQEGGAGGSKTSDTPEVHPSGQPDNTGGRGNEENDRSGIGGAERPAAVEKVIDPKKVEKPLEPKEKKAIEQQPEAVKALDDKVETLDLPEEQAEAINTFINRNSDENGNLDWDKVEPIIAEAGDDPAKIAEAIVQHNEREKENQDNAGASEGISGDSGTQGDSEGERIRRTDIPASRSDVAGSSGDSPRLTTVGANLTPTVQSRVLDGLKEHLAPHQLEGANLALNALATGKKAFLLADGAGAGKSRQLLAFAESAGKPVTIVTENRDIINGSFKNDAKTMGLSFTAGKEATKIGKNATIVTVPDFRSGKYPKNSVLIFDESQNASGTESKTFEELGKHKGFVLFASATPFDTIQKTLYMVPRLLGVSEKQYLNEIGGKWQDSHRGGRELVIQDGPDLLDYLKQAHNELLAEGQLVSRYFPFHGNNRGSIQLRNDVADTAGSLVTKDEKGQPVNNTHPNPGAVLSNMTLADGEAGVNNYYGRRILIVSKMGLSKEDLKTPSMTVEKKLRKLREEKNNALQRLSDTFKATKELAQSVKRDLSEGKQVVIYSPNVHEALRFKYGEPPAKEEGGEGGGAAEFEYTRPSFFHQFSDILNQEGVKFESLTGENKKRDETVDRFEKGDTKVLLINQSGTTGINLNDTKGDSPRILYKVGNPPNAIQNDQLEGRVSRMNNASRAEVVSVRNGGEGDRLAAEKHEEKAALMNAFVKGEVMGELPNGEPRVAEQPAGPPKIEAFNEKQFSVVNTKGDPVLRKKFDELGGNFRDDKKAWIFPNSKKAAVEEILAGHKPGEKPTYGYEDLPEAVRLRNEGPDDNPIEVQNKAAAEQLTPDEQKVAQEPAVKEKIDRVNNHIDAKEITPSQEDALQKLMDSQLDENGNLKPFSLKDLALDIDLTMDPEDIADEIFNKLTNEGQGKPGPAERSAADTNEGEIRAAEPEQGAEGTGLPEVNNPEANPAGDNAAAGAGQSRDEQNPAAGSEGKPEQQSQPGTGAIARPEKTGNALEDAVNEYNYWQQIVSVKQRRLELKEEHDPAYEGTVAWEHDKVALHEAQLRQKIAQKEARNLESISASDKIRKLKIKGGDKLLTTPLQIPVALWNAAVEVVALAVEAGEHINRAVQKGVDYVNSHHFTDWKEEEFRKELYDNSLIHPTADELRAKKDDGVRLNPKNRVTADRLLEHIRNNEETLFGALHKIDGVRKLSPGNKEKIKDYIRDIAKAEIFKGTGDRWADEHMQASNYDYDAALRSLADDVNMQLLGAHDEVERENIRLKAAAASAVIETEQTSHKVATGELVQPDRQDRVKKEYPLNLPEHTNLQGLKENLFNSLSRLEQVIKHTEADITPENDAVTAKTLAPSKAHYDVKQTLDYLGSSEREVGSVFYRWKKDGIDIRDMGEFLMAEHAPEANAKIAKNRKYLFEQKMNELKDKLATEQDAGKAEKIQNEIDILKAQSLETPREYLLMPDGGVGMTDEEAANVFAKHHANGTFDKYQKYADEFRENVIEPILEWKHDTEMISDDLYNVLHPANGFKKYTPAKVDFSGDEVDEAGNSVYGNKDIKDNARDLHRRKGAADIKFDERNNPVFQAIHDLTQSIVKGYENEANLKMLQLMRDSPNPNIWKEVTADYDVQKDAAGNVLRATEINKPTMPAIEVREGGVKKYIVLHDPGLQKLAKQVGPQWLENFARGLQRLTTLVRVTNTNLNLDFLVKNPLMDFGDAWLNLVPEENTAILKNYTKYIAQAAYIIPQMMRGDKDNLWVQRRDQAAKAGALITFNEKLDLSQSAERTMKLYEKYNDPLGAARIKHTFRAIRRMTDALEEVTRTVVFQASIEAGETPDRAAMLARNSTVDFAKKGVYGTYINAVKAFANASIQGLGNVVYAATKSKRVRKFLVSMVGLGFAEAMVNDQLGDCAGKKKEDCWWEIAEYKKMKNLYIPDFSGHGTQYSIPLPRNFAWFNYLGKNIYAMAFPNKRSGERLGFGEFLANSASALNDFYSPVGGAPIGQTLAGNFAPVVGLYTNKTAFDSDIYPSYEGSPKPRHLKFWPNSTPETYKEITELLSEYTGGRPGKPGKLEISPNQLEYVMQSVGGGVYTELKNAAISADSLGHGQLPKAKNVPMLRVFHSENDMSGTKNLFSKLFDKGTDELLTEKEWQKAEEYANDLVKAQVPGWTPERVGKALNFLKSRQAAVRGEVRKETQGKGKTDGAGTGGSF